MDFKLNYLKKDTNLKDNIEYSNYILTVLKEVQKMKEKKAFRLLRNALNLLKEQ